MQSLSPRRWEGDVRWSRGSTAECRSDMPATRVRLPPAPRNPAGARRGPAGGCSSTAEYRFGRPVTRVRLPPAPRSEHVVRLFLALGTSGDVGSLSMSIRRVRFSSGPRTRLPHPRGRTWAASSNGRILRSHRSNGGSNPLQSTASRQTRAATRRGRAVPAREGLEYRSVAPRRGAPRESRIPSSPPPHLSRSWSNSQAHGCNP